MATAPSKSLSARRRPAGSMFSVLILGLSLLIDVAALICRPPRSSSYTRSPAGLDRRLRRRGDPHACGACCLLGRRCLRGLAPQLLRLLVLLLGLARQSRAVL